MERRQASRCPVCQGPAKEDDAAPEGVRCRNSCCIHNHADVECPRCGIKDIESVSYVNGVFQFKCRDCLKSWGPETPDS